MILDNQLVFSAAQAVTTVDDHPSTNVVDLTVTGDALDSLWLEVGVHTLATGTAGGTVTVTLETSVDEAFTAPITLLTTSAFATADLVKGKKLIQSRIPMGTKRYLRVVYTIETQALTGGKFNAYLVSGVDKLD